MTRWPRSRSSTSTAARAIASPDAAHRQALGIGTKLEARLRVRDSATAEERLAFVEQLLLHDFVSLVPRIMPAPAAGIAMLQLALVGHGDGLESLVRMRSYPAPLLPRREGVGGSVIEQQKGAQLAAKTVVVEHGADGKPVAHPVRS